MLQEQQIFLVMRDKLSPQSLEEQHLSSSPFSLLRFRVAHSDRSLALMVDAEPRDMEDRELLFTIGWHGGGREYSLEALAGGERTLLNGVESDVVRSFSSVQHPSLGGNRKWRVVLLPLEFMEQSDGCITLSIDVQGDTHGSFEGVLKIV